MVNDLKKQILRNWSQIVKKRKALYDQVQKMYSRVGVVVSKEEEEYF